MPKIISAILFCIFDYADTTLRILASNSTRQEATYNRSTIVVNNITCGLWPISTNLLRNTARNYGGP